MLVEALEFQQGLQGHRFGTTKQETTRGSKFGMMVGTLQALLNLQEMTSIRDGLLAQQVKQQKGIQTMQSML